MSNVYEILSDALEDASDGMTDDVEVAELLIQDLLMLGGSVRGVIIREVWAEILRYARGQQAGNPAGHKTATPASGVQEWEEYVDTRPIIKDGPTIRVNAAAAIEIRVAAAINQQIAEGRISFE